MYKKMLGTELTEIIPLKCTFPSDVAESPPAMHETQLQFLGWEDPLEKKMPTHSSIFV